MPNVPLQNKNRREKRITAQQVADRAGVSLSAVSRSFTPGASVSPQTLKKVRHAAEALGYQPNVMARSLMTGRTELIGLVSNNFDNPAFMEIFDLFTRHLQDHGLRPLLANLSNNADPIKAIAMLQQYSVDGVIIASSSISPDFIRGCAAADIPMVHAFGKSQAERHVIGVDNVQGGVLAAQTLIQHGYQRMAFLGGPASASSTIDRLQGFRRGLKKRGLVPVHEVFASHYAHDAGHAEMQQLLDREDVEAVFCGDDILAMGALDACRDRGRSVPNDIGVIGFNDIAMASWSAYQLTTIRQPIAQIIVAAVERVIQLVANRHLTPQAQAFDCELVLRGTLRKI